MTVDNNRESEDLYEVHQHQFAENCGDAEQGQPVAHIEDCVLQRKLPGQTVHSDDELDTVGLQGEQHHIIEREVFRNIFTFNRVLLFIS